MVVVLVVAVPPVVREVAVYPGRDLVPEPLDVTHGTVFTTFACA